MTLRENVHDIKVVHLKDQTAVTSATQTTDTLDTLGYESASIVWDVSVWAGAASTWTLTLTESDSSSTGFTTVTALNVEWFKDGVLQTGLNADGTGPVIQDANTDQCTYSASYVAGTKRYLRGVATLSGTPTTMVLVPFGVLGRPRELGVKAYTNWSA